MKPDLAAVGAAPGDMVKDPAWADRPLTEFIEHVLLRFIASHRREIPDLADLARKVEARHRMHELVPAGLADALTAFGAELEMHMTKEETALFPLIHRGSGDELDDWISAMRGEHDEYGAKLRVLSEITRNFNLPPDACSSWQRLYAGVEKLVDDVKQHIQIENDMLFPRFIGHPPDRPSS